MRKLSERSGGNRSGGFTLLETLLAVAILVILLGLSTVGVARYRDHLKIAELDNAARDIYMAAENRAVLLQNSGQLGTPSATLLSSIETVSEGNKIYMLSNNTVSTTLDEMLPVGTIDPALRGKNFRVIYDAVTGHVIETFYSEGTIGAELTDYRKSRSDRVSNKRMVGWYKSEAADEIGTHPLPTPGVEVIIENGNELTLTVRYTMPSGGLPAGVKRTPSVKLEYDGVEVTLLNVDGSGNIVPLDDSRRTINGDITDSAVTVAEYTWVLDSLESGKQFKGLTGSVALGDDFTVTASLKLEASGHIDSAYYATGTDNSLFAKGSTYNTTDGTAKIANLRHLQNLDKENSFKSNVGPGTVKAEQLCDVDCEASLHNDNTSINSNYNFTPIVNGTLASYDGGNNSISSLKAAVTGDAGLFGTVSHNLTIDNCRVCWNAPDKLVNSGDYVYAICGANAGGLIGNVAGGNVKITNSFAATTVKGTTAAGGLIGTVASDDTVDISNSYADCYLTGGNAGGLVGSGSANELKNCYAAGFITGGSNTAGLVNGGLASVSCAYSVVRVIGEDGKLEAPASLLYNGTNETDGVRYLSKAADAVESIFGYIAKPETHAYDLRYERDNSVESLKEKTYPYSGVKDMGGTLLPHYGDWADLEDETLIPLPEADIKITVVNSEELTLTVEYTLPKLPEGLAYSEVTRTPSVVVNYQYTDAGGNDKTAMAELPFTGAGRTPTTTSDKTIDAAGTGETVSYTWVLDSLEKGVFKDLGFKDESGALIDLAFGGDFTVSARLWLTTGKDGYEPSNKAVPLESAKENSLFSKDTTSDTAMIANLRHLQNLDSDHSGAGEKTAAVQTVWTSRETESVRTFDDDGMEVKTLQTTVTETKVTTTAATKVTTTTTNGGTPSSTTTTTAGDPRTEVIDASKVMDNEGNITINAYEFKPIENDDLSSYDGKNMTIENLTVTAASAAGKNGAGLFGAVSAPDFKFRDVCLKKSTVTVESVNAAGALLGYWWVSVSFENCRVINTTVSNGSLAGGMAGYFWGADKTASFKDCAVEGTLNVTSSGSYAGGLMGWTGNGKANFTNCSVGGDGKAIAITGTNAGGLLGNHGNEKDPDGTATFTNCTVGKSGAGQAQTVSIRGGAYTGGLVGNSKDGTFTNCNVYNAAVGNDDNSTSESGGLAGRATSTSFKECAAKYLTVKGNANAGGLLGGAVDVKMGELNGPLCIAEHVTVTAVTSAGGLVGNAARGEFVNCKTSNANVTGTASNGDAGGLVGRTMAHATNEEVTDVSGTKFTNCTTENSTVKGEWNVGGLLGFAEKATLNGCETANVSAEALVHAGGLVGYSDNGEFTGCKAVNVIAVSHNWNCESGGLIGGTEHSVKLDKCWVYWDGTPKSYSVDADNNNAAGGTAGGLVGAMRGGGTIANSFAATTVRGNTYAGGLVGELPDEADTVTVTNSYADCDIQNGFSGGTWSSAGGLIGIKGAKSDLTLKNVYAAGFINTVGEEGKMAGGVYGGWSDSGIHAENVYTAIYYTGHEKTTTYPLAAGLAWGQGLETNCYWMNYSGLQCVNNYDSGWWKKDCLSYAEMCNLSLGEAFETKNAADTHRYGLSANASTETTYPFPGLVGLPHYGDWLKN